MVVYIDTVAGGIASTVDLTDSADGLRRAISGFDGGANRSLMSFDGDFRPEYAAAFDQNFAGLWQITENGLHVFQADLGLSPTATETASSYSFSIDLADIAVAANSGTTFGFVTTYISDSGFRSEESIGNDVAGTSGWNAFTSGSAQLYTTVPEPTIALLGSLGVLGLLRRRR